MESRIHGDMYVRFGGRLAETYHRKVEKRCGPSLLKNLSDLKQQFQTWLPAVARKSICLAKTSSNLLGKPCLFNTFFFQSFLNPIPS